MRWFVSALLSQPNPILVYNNSRVSSLSENTFTKSTLLLYTSHKNYKREHASRKQSISANNWNLGFRAIYGSIHQVNLTFLTPTSFEYPIAFILVLIMDRWCLIPRGLVVNPVLFILAPCDLYLHPLMIFLI